MHMLAFVHEYDIRDLLNTATYAAWVDGPTTAMAIAQITGRQVVLICPKNIQPHLHQLWGTHNPWDIYPVSKFKVGSSETQQAPFVISYIQYTNAEQIKDEEHINA